MKKLRHCHPIYSYMSFVAHSVVFFSHDMFCLYCA